MKSCSILWSVVQPGLCDKRDINVVVDNFLGEEGVFVSYCLCIYHGYFTLHAWFGYSAF